MENKLELKPITNLLDKRFTIPSYQRGYRWDNRQITNMLDDIWSFSKESENGPNESFYCLQPIVVSKNGEEWEVLDGQQRLTTINILLKYLNESLVKLGKSNYSIEYKTRPSTESFLKNIDLTKKDENIDYYYICNAYETIEEWFKVKKGNIKDKFIQTLLNKEELGKNVKVIWYDVTDENTSNNYAIDIFTRLNIGKIPLTNSELIKALFLQKSNFNVDKVYLKQLQIASEWDQIERELHNELFWSFIYNETNSIKYDNRIEYIFDLMTNKTKNNDRYFTFFEFSKEFYASRTESAKHIDQLWLKIKKYYLTLKEWNENKELYHLIGFLIHNGANIANLKEVSSTKTKLDFIQYIKAEIKKQINCNIEDLVNLEYNDHRVSKILLLFNLQTILATDNCDIKFPFNHLKKGKWDIEHVRSQKEKLITKAYYKDWIKDILEYYTGVEDFNNQETKSTLSEVMEGLSDNDKKHVHKLYKLFNTESISESEFTEIYETITAEFKESDSFDINNISNLAILDVNTNRSYKNALFCVKRKRIIQNEMNGIFVPICTKNVFLKSYSKKLGEVMYWTTNDSENYLNAIKNVLKDYIPSKNQSNDNTK